jgi:cell division protein FtsZ
MGMAMMGAATASGPSRAREAAIAAVSSPLLEDINISGARGILVNITAGLDMSIGEFEEVGNAIKEFASDDATVVIGTVIDPELHDELRVTVVATGLGQEKMRSKQPYKVVKTGTGTTDYEDFETPTVIRNRRTERPMATQTEAAIEYLDIPAFLRKQAD